MTQLEVDVTFWWPRCSRSAPMDPLCSLAADYGRSLVEKNRWILSFQTREEASGSTEVDFHFWSLMNTYQGNFCGFSERRMSKNVMVYHSFPNWKWYALVFPWFLDQLKCWCEETNSYYTMGRGWISQTIPALLRLMTDQDHDGSHIKAPQMLSPETSSSHFSCWYLVIIE